MLWRDISCYDALTRTRLPVPKQPVTLTFTKRRKVSLFRPTKSAGVLKEFAAATSVKVPVAAELVIARIS